LETVLLQLHVASKFYLANKKFYRSKKVPLN